MSRAFNHDRRSFLGAAAVFAAGGRLGTFGSVVGQMACAARQGTVGPEMPTLDGATGWLNSPPLTAAGLRGRVVLVDFWTYSCINWLRTLPYVRAWAARYREQGLVVIGVHSPEFEFEKDVANVRRAVTDMHVDYPVAIDSKHAVWNAFNNAYWPALYLVDARGRIRYQHPGEGEYDRSENAIQRLLTEAGVAGVGQDLVKVDARGVEAAADWGSLRSPEAYVGYARGEKFASPGGVASNRSRVYSAPRRLALNEWALAGDWRVGPEAAVSGAASGRIEFRFHARDLHLVMGASASGARVRFRLRIDGQPPGTAHGADVDEHGSGVVAEPRLYQLVRQPGAVADRQLEIEFLDTGVEVFSFTFG